MEEIIKSLQGKTLSKNKIFDFLSNLDLKKLDKKIQCDACMKIFSKEINLKNHQAKNIQCLKWIALPQKHNVQLKKGIHLVVDELLKKSIDADNLECSFCNSKFINTGNHRKHLNRSPVCNRLAFNEFKEHFMRL